MFEQTFKNIDDILHKDAGCGSELDYVEQTSWILFLKYLDDFEKDKKTAAELADKSYEGIIDKQYKWEVWAVPKGKDGKIDHHKALTGDDLKDFVDHKLFPYLKKFKTSAESADTIEYKIGEIFSELKNKIQSGYNLREVINRIDELRFRSHVVAPTIGNKVYDGAVASAGFLAEAFEYLKTSKNLTTKDAETLQKKTFYGKEKMSLAYIIGTMNMILHGIEAPNIVQYQHAGGKPGRYPGKRPLRHHPCQSTVWRQGTSGGTAELPYQNRRNRLSVPPAFHQNPQSGRKSGCGNQKHLSFQYGQCVCIFAQTAVGKL